MAWLSVSTIEPPVVDYDLPALDVGVVEQGQRKNWSGWPQASTNSGRPSPSVSCTSLVGEIVATEDRAQRAAPLDQEGIEHLRSGGVVLCALRRDGTAVNARSGS